MNICDELKRFFEGKRVFLTGNTGFKGSWLSAFLLELGAKVYGYALKPDTEISVYRLLGLSGREEMSEIGDVRDFAHLQESYVRSRPDIVIHLAAQPIVREGYRSPRETFETNVMGTVNLLECARLHPGAVSFLNVTTDKVYHNADQEDHAFTEEEPLDGFDPYSNSKSCSELVTHSYVNSFFSAKDCALSVSTVRAGNVIGGGDFATDRIVPDCVRAAVKGEAIKVRNPNSTRPYQHVLEPLFAYLLIAMKQASKAELSGYYNVGPDERDAINTGRIAELFVQNWGRGASWVSSAENGAPKEASYLKLNSSKVKKVFGWKPVWNVEEAVKKTVEWYRAYYGKENMFDYTMKQIREYCGGQESKDII